jgi:hypothetical protein
MNICKLEQQLYRAVCEFESIRNMPEADVCRLYNVDDRGEIEAIVLEDIALLNADIEMEKAKEAEMEEEDMYLFNY